MRSHNFTSPDQKCTFCARAKSSGCVREHGAYCRQTFPHADIELGPELVLDNPASIKAFATAYRQQKRPLHVLINNAGANYMSEGSTANGIPLLTQVT